MNSKEAYGQLCDQSKRVSYLASAMAVLHWDQRTSIPPKGHAHRANQLAALAQIHHRMITDPKIGEWLSKIEESSVHQDPLSVEGVNTREWRRVYDRAVKIPERLAVELAKAASEGQSAWEKARPENDWFVFKPFLERIVSLKREQAEALGYEKEAYDALVDSFEHGASVSELQPIFKVLIDGLVEILDAIQGSSKTHASRLETLKFPIETQKAFALQVAQALGYDMEAGKLDVSAHPFTIGIGPGDVRITTRYSEDSFGESFFGVVHETGHALYHQGLPVEQWGLPICKPASLGINESQSRMWENMIARSRPFWIFYYPKAQEYFSALRDIPLEEFYRSLNQVSSSLIRTEADEVTYNIHVLLRFELEVMLCRGELDVEDLPEAWNAKMKKYLGLKPPSYSDGVMQDVHWSSGAIGYFPTYTLGNLYAAQFCSKMAVDMQDLEGTMQRGEFSSILEWLREKIHIQGARYLPRELVQTVTGEQLDPQYLMNYLRKKYFEIYDVS